MNQDAYLDESFKNHDFTSEQLLGIEFDNCAFDGCNFDSQNLKGVRFLECTFNNCNLSNTMVEKASFHEVTFTNCKMLGIHFTRCNRIGFAIQAIGCQLSHSIFHQMDLTRSQFPDCLMHEVDLAETALIKVSLVRCDLRDAMFDLTDLHGADLSGAINYSIDPDRNNIKNARFSYPDVLALLSKYQIEVD